ncbi:hypothetical protein [Novosphingobium album (ex Liu et al. 2023)]|uniref:UDP-N-acetylglucosamine 2-epimerase domain-containing protein n=1 Tax=Novosphingobium album (ex Liu et al. 2023) TaxID=3031130 RepID=A0ABT5WTH8_9SPHN|nr:hypothetical protein [Novosphingobium album (ex Liu et al. 2023)]MDE8653185.1 hypothetical protein [Novosphingobium album (ex Liu et al. 2023)]
MLTGGAADQTLAAIMAQVAAIAPTVEILPIDIRGTVSLPAKASPYDGPGQIVRADPAGFGMHAPLSPRQMRRYRWPFGQGRRTFVRTRDQAGAFLKARGADLVVVSSDKTFIQAAFVLGARFREIPIALAQPGPLTTIGRAGGALRFVPRSETYGTLIRYDLILATTLGDALTFMDQTKTKENVVSIGAPRLDALCEECCRERDEARSQEILYLQQPLAQDGIIDPVREANLHALTARLLNEVGRGLVHRIVLRSHPRARGDGLAVLRDAVTGSVVEEHGQIPVAEAARSASLVVGHYSVAMLEAAVVGAPVLCVPVAQDAFRSQSEAAKQRKVSEALGGADSFAEQVVAGRAALRQEHVAPRLDRVMEILGELDGKAARRGAEALITLLSERAPPLALQRGG